MTVGVVVVAGDADALADAVGRPLVRRIVDSAWAGGAMPIIVVAGDDDDAIARAISGSPARLHSGEATGWLAYRAGALAAAEAVGETDAVLLWPMTMAWVDPETVTSLIEAHGRRPGRLLRPRYGETPGWPLLLPLAAVETMTGPAESDITDAASSAGEWQLLDLGDPGAVHGIEVAMDALPAYDGPPEPVGGPPPEWGAAAADTPD